MTLPRDIIEKYNFLKQNTFESLGLVFQPGTILTNSERTYIGESGSSCIKY